jgi:hypothetical protein
MHFQTWHDKAGNAPPLTDGALVFPDLNAEGSQTTQTNLILPEPTRFLYRNQWGLRGQRSRCDCALRFVDEPSRDPCHVVSAALAGAGGGL